MRTRQDANTRGCSQPLSRSGTNSLWGAYLDGKDHPTSLQGTCTGGRRDGSGGLSLRGENFGARLTRGVRAHFDTQFTFTLIHKGTICLSSIENL